MEFEIEELERVALEDLIATTTGEEVPGDPQIFCKNIAKMGFGLTYVRKNHAPPKEA